MAKLGYDCAQAIAGIVQVNRGAMTVRLSHEEEREEERNTA